MLAVPVVAPALPAGLPLDAERGFLGAALAGAAPFFSGLAGAFGAGAGTLAAGPFAAGPFTGAALAGAALAEATLTGALGFAGAFFSAFGAGAFGFASFFWIFFGFFMILGGSSGFPGGLGDF